jgi:ribosomal protein S21
MIEVKKSENESTIGLIKRFTKKIKESGILSSARYLRFRNRPKSDLRKKKEAIKKVQRKKKIDYLRKLGKIE